VVRDFAINTKAFLGNGSDGIRALRPVGLEQARDNGRPLPCELVLLALGFLGPDTDTVISHLGYKITGPRDRRRAGLPNVAAECVRMRRPAMGTRF
jgi:hypothetical protein